MAQSMAPATATPDPRRKIDDVAIAPPPARHYRAHAFQIYVLSASAVFVVLAVVAHTVAYFPIDLTVTRAVQSYHGAAFDRLMYAVSWIGFMPQVNILGGVVVLLMFLTGLRWESATASARWSSWSSIARVRARIWFTS